MPRSLRIIVLAVASSVAAGDVAGQIRRPKILLAISDDQSFNKLDTILRQRGDPRIVNNGDVFDTYRYFAGPTGQQQPIRQLQEGVVK